MQMTTYMTTAITGAMLLGAAVPCVAQGETADKDREIRMLKRELSKSRAQYHVLARDLAASKKRERLRHSI